MCCLLLLYNHPGNASGQNWLLTPCFGKSLIHTGAQRQICFNLAITTSSVLSFGLQFLETPQMNWEALRRLVATPKASEQKSEVEVGTCVVPFQLRLAHVAFVCIC